MVLMQSWKKKKKFVACRGWVSQIIVDRIKKKKFKELNNQSLKAKWDHIKVGEP